MTTKHITDFVVKQNIRLNHDTFVLLLQHPGVMPPIYPGQFAEVRVDRAPDVFLRRPLSVHDVDTEANTLSFFVKVVGKGTDALLLLQPGDILNVVYPLGNTFTILNNKKVLLAGGGCGIAPLLFLARRLKEAGNDVHILTGAKSQCDILLTEKYSAFGQVHVTTDDGSMGVKGLIIQHPDLKNEINSFDQIYTCGPERMMQAVARMAEENGVPCEVSLENTMACGIGACLCCVTPTKDGHKCVCTDGPIFNSKDLKWQI